MLNTKNKDVSLVCNLNYNIQISNFWKTSFLLFGMLLDTKTLYTATNLNCNYLIENAYYGSKSTKTVCVHCGAADIISAEYKSKLKQYKNVFPVCQYCFTKGKNEIRRSLVEPLISTSNKGN